MGEYHMLTVQRSASRQGVALVHSMSSEMRLDISLYRCSSKPVERGLLSFSQRINRAVMGVVAY